LLPLDVARRVDLRDAREPGADAVPLLVAGHVLERLEAAVTRGLDLAGTERTRPDEAHVAAEDAPELRQFVHGGRPHQPADASDAGVVRAGLQGADIALGVGNHRSELIRAEHAPALADALLRVEDRPAIFELDDRGQQQPQRRGSDEASAGEQDVERALACGNGPDHHA
jgi:hypothetical protein